MQRQFASIVIALGLLAAACGGDSGNDIDLSADPGPIDTTLISVPPETLGNEHVQPPVTFAQSPSIGGDHLSFWQNCGFYDVEVIEGAATHTLEHGAIWITFNPERTSDAQRAELAAMAQDNPRLLISPYPHIERIVLSGWGVQQRTDAVPGDAIVAEFIEQWQDGEGAPESGVTCEGAVGVPPDGPTLFPGGQELPEDQFN